MTNRGLAQTSRGQMTYVSHASRQASRFRRVCSSRMMVVKKYGEAISQERIVGNSSLEEFFLHITRQIWPKLKRGLT
jgi:hypothetical protein